MKTIDYAFFLLQIADTVKDEPKDTSDLSGDVEYSADNGWKVAVFYDCGEFDYISYFIDSYGKKIDFWEWPDCEAKKILRAYSNIGDTERLMEAFKYTGAKDSDAISIQQPAARLTSPALDTVDGQACSTQTAEKVDL